MRVLEGDHTTWAYDGARTAVTVGVYDGVHRGHQEVLAALRERAGDLAMTVVTFRQHPATVITPASAPQMLTSVDQRLELLEGHGVDLVALLDFDDRIRHLQPARFVAEVLVEALQVGFVAVGARFRFGYRLRGDGALLRELGNDHGFAVVEIPIVGGDRPVRSTAIRAALATGDVAAAAAMLGRPFQLRSPVVEGDHRGHQLGFPTANLIVPLDLARPRRGVYAARAGVGAADQPAVVNVGIRPTIGGDQEFVEVHVLDAELDLYGEELWVDFVARLRDEQRFSGLDELVAQITRDVNTARQILAASD